MTSPTPIRFEPHGPAGVGLTPWEKIDPASLSAGDPVQRGHQYFQDDTGTLTAGVWDCTPMTAKLEPYAVNEFMLVLEGSVTIVDAAGKEETMRAGESFIIPKGMPCIWKQPEYIRKFYVIFDDPSGEMAEPEELKVIRVDSGCDLPPIGEQDTSRYKGTVPEQHVLGHFKDATGQMQVGSWDTTDMHTHAQPFGRNELMHLLEGSVSFQGEDGVVRKFDAGDTFLVPKGTHYQWDSEGYVRKIYCIFQPR